MEIFKKRLIGIALSFILASLLIMVWYGFYIIHAQDYFISIWGDGFKNYFTFAYYVFYDHGSHFTGMNYPFGEHVVFTDDQPVLAFLFKYLAHIGFVRNHLHGLFTICTFLSVSLCASIVFMIFDEYDIRGLYAVISAVFIALLSPQIVRLSAHFGLSYSFFIPLTLLFLIRASKTRRDLYLILFSFAVTLFGLIHIYHLAIITFFALTYSVLYYMISPKNKTNRWFFIKQIIAALAPFIFIKVFMFLTDPVTDRPDTPWGFFETCSTYDTVFLMPDSFIYHFINRFVDMPKATGERWSYIGVMADLILIIFVGSSIVRFSLTRRIFKDTSPTILVALAASVILLLFSFGLPFTIGGCRGLFDYMGPLKQFRAPCRFAWPFYYVSNIFCVVYIARLINVFDGRIWIKRGLAISMFIIWFIDLNVVNNNIRHDISGGGGAVDMEDEQVRVKKLLQRSGFSNKDFQGFLYLPYFTTGSEKTVISYGGDIMGMKVALYTGLKMIDAEMSRTSLMQVNMNVQLTASALLHKEVLKLYPNKLPLLMAVAINESITPEEKALIMKGVYIGSEFVWPDTLRFYSLPLTAFDDTAGVIRSRFDRMVSDMYKHHGYLSSDSADDVVAKTYDDIKAPFVRFGNGALYLEDRDTLLYDGVLPGAHDSALYEFSVWNYGDHRVCVYPGYRISIYDQSQNLIAKYEKQGYQSRDVFENWKRTSARFILPSKDNIVKIEAKGKFATYDELMIKPQKIEVLTHYQDSTFFMYNNYPIIR